MKPRKNTETDAHYIKRLEDANVSLQQENARIKKWASDLNEAVTVLSCEASLAFQAMAEKAGIRSHPSVTEAVQLFDSIAFPQWRGEKKIPKVAFPQFWDLDSPRAWSGDADMQLNSPIASAIEFLQSHRWGGGEALIREIDRICDGLHRLTIRGVQGLKDGHGFKPLRTAPISKTHYRDMSAEELRNLVNAATWMALDLAQDMSYANEMLRRDLRAACYRRVCGDLYRLSQLGFGDGGRDERFDIYIAGGTQEPF